MALRRSHSQINWGINGGRDSIRVNKREARFIEGNAQQAFFLQRVRGLEEEVPYPENVVNFGQAIGGELEKTLRSVKGDAAIIGEALTNLREIDARAARRLFWATFRLTGNVASALVVAAVLLKMSGVSGAFAAGLDRPVSGFSDGHSHGHNYGGSGPVVERGGQSHAMVLEAPGNSHVLNGRGDRKYLNPNNQKDHNPKGRKKLKPKQIDSEPERALEPNRDGIGVGGQAPVAAEISTGFASANDEDGIVYSGDIKEKEVLVSQTKFLEKVGDDFEEVLFSRDVNSIQKFINEVDPERLSYAISFLASRDPDELMRHKYTVAAALNILMQHDPEKGVEVATKVFRMLMHELENRPVGVSMEDPRAFCHSGVVWVILNIFGKYQRINSYINGKGTEQIQEILANGALPLENVVGALTPEERRKFRELLWQEAADLKSPFFNHSGEIEGIKPEAVELLSLFGIKVLEPGYKADKIVYLLASGSIRDVLVHGNRVMLVKDPNDPKVKAILDSGNTEGKPASMQKDNIADPLDPLGKLLTTGGSKGRGVYAESLLKDLALGKVSIEQGLTFQELYEKSPDLAIQQLSNIIVYALLDQTFRNDDVVDSRTGKLRDTYYMYPHDVLSTVYDLLGEFAYRLARNSALDRDDMLHIAEGVWQKVWDFYYSRLEYRNNLMGRKVMRVDPVSRIVGKHLLFLNVDEEWIVGQRYASGEYRWPLLREVLEQDPREKAYWVKQIRNFHSTVWLTDLWGVVYPHQEAIIEALLESGDVTDADVKNFFTHLIVNGDSLDTDNKWLRIMLTRILVKHPHLEPILIQSLNSLNDSILQRLAYKDCHFSYPDCRSLLQGIIINYIEWKSSPFNNMLNEVAACNDLNCIDNVVKSENNSHAFETFLTLMNMFMKARNGDDLLYLEVIEEKMEKVLGDKSGLFMRYLKNESTKDNGKLQNFEAVRRWLTSLKAEEELEQRALPPIK